MQGERCRRPERGLPQSVGRRVVVLRRTVPITVVAVLALLGLPGGGVHASIAQDTVVSPDPANFTPNVESDGSVSDSAVHALEQRKGIVFAGGAFRTVTDADGIRTYLRHNLVAFSATTGAVRTFAPNVNGTVWAIEKRKGALFVGGEFTSVDGVARPGLVKINARSGSVVTAFRPPFAGGIVTEIRSIDGRLIVGGTFPGKLRALDPKTGADTGFIDLAITGTLADNAGPTKVYRFAVNPAGTRLVAVGNFTQVGGVHRRQAFMLDLGGNRASVAPWYYSALDNACAASSIPAYLRDVDFSPDGSYFVIVATGFIPRSGGLGRDVCDAAARFETHVDDPTRPTWINYTGGDTLHAVAVTGAAVYVQGHQRWLDNEFGVNDAGPGAVPREGIGAIDPDTGKALAWNPGKTRGVGGKDLLVTRAGLWVGSDGVLFAGEHRARIAFCPL